MIRILRVFALALVAILTMGFAASSAPAVEFHSEATSTTLSGAQEGTNTVVTDSGTIHCTTDTFSGSQSEATVAQVELTQTTTGCQSTGFISANVTVDTNGCKYNMTAATSNEMVHITGCEAGKPGIVVTAPFCTITVTPQTFGPVDYEEAGSGTTRELIVNSTVENISYHESGFACAHSGSTTSGGKLSGKVRVTGVNASTGKHVGIAPTPLPPAVEFHSEATSTTLSGAQEGTNTVVTDSGTIHCTTDTFSGSQSEATVAQVELTQTTTGCQSTGFISANVTVDTNGCKYNMTAATSNEMVHITGCEAGKPGIVVTAPFCTITVTPQTIGPVDYETAGSAGTTHDVIVNTTIGNVAYHESGFACAHSGSTTTGGLSTGRFRVTGVDASTGAHVGLTVA